jgi:hypothetical protein
MMLGAHLFSLPNVSQTDLKPVVGGRQQPTCFLSVTWHGAFYWLGVQGVEVLIVFGALFPPSVAPATQQHF